MLKTLWNGRSGLHSNQTKIDTISNNIANLNTNGYKKADVSFEDIFYEKVQRLGTPITGDNPQNLVYGSGSRPASIVMDFKQGNLQATGKMEDLAISGEGYFRLIGEDGQYYYSRDGAFSLDQDGSFVHSSGYRLDIEGFNPIDAGSDFNISPNGEINSNNTSMGKINIYSFTTYDGATAHGNSLLTFQGEEQMAQGEIKQGFVEGSNVDLAKELTDMIVTQRGFELNSRVVRSADEMWQMTNNLRGR